MNVFYTNSHFWALVLGDGEWGYPQIFQFHGDLRQDGFFSPYLFIVTTEFLSQELDCLHSRYPSMLSNMVLKLA